MDRTLVMMRPNGTQDNANHGQGHAGDAAVGEERVREERKRYTTQLQRRAQAAQAVGAQEIVMGVSGLIPTAGSWTALLSEGGHVTFSPANETEVAILQFAWRQYEHVSAERLMSGDGLELIYRAMAHHTGQPDEKLTAADISRRALAGDDQLCGQVIDIFCGMLGTVAGNLAVTLGAQGGIYIGGGIVPRLGARFDQSPFRKRFEQKGRFVNYLSQVPTFVITAEYPAFLGVSTILAEKLGA